MAFGLECATLDVTQNSLVVFLGGWDPRIRLNGGIIVWVKIRKIKTLKGRQAGRQAGEGAQIHTAWRME